MAVVIGLVGAALGGVLGVLATYLTTRSSLRLSLSHDYDRALRDKRLAHYQALFRISGAITRAWINAPDMTPQGLFEFRQELHGWYYGPGAPGMFLTPSAKHLFVAVVNRIEAAAFDTDTDSATSTGSSPLLPATPHVRMTPLAPEEVLEIRSLVSELRHQLAEDVGASQPPYLRWMRPPA